LALSRPVKPRTASEHLVTLSRMSRAIEVDEHLDTRHKRRLLRLISQLMQALHKELDP